ncbi:Vesicle coat complex COPII, subunit SEC13 [Handroanthus impetiginosus]|uniref:Vesicle coat complex COPII, subunit SEC13 n=1 Tax=Handroanthus impetiginosus TaxID=429701 RepID=A0A2G9I9F6_9LAMI|nr:Vesicle coat complex COPII, subunit SEC13 [Handroanthus impetiginosus]
MRIRCWLSTCSSTTSTAISGDSSAPSPPPKSLISDTSSTFSDTQTQSSNSGIQSNLSLLTLPSVPSLQKLILSPQTAAENSSATAIFLTSPKPHRRAHINFLTLHNNLLYAAVGNEINVYEIINNTLFDTFNAEKEYSGAVKSIAFSDGKIFTAHQDCKIRVWKLNDQKQHKLISTLPTLEDRFRRFLLPQNYVKVRRHKKKLWIEHHDAVSGLATFENDNGRNKQISGNMCENLALSISWDKSIKIWQARSFHCQESINKAHEDAINAVVISKDGLIYTGSADKRIKVWKKEDKKYGLIATLEKHKSAVNALALNLDGSVLFSGSCDRSILVWEREDSANHMAVTGALRGHAKAILCLINVRDLLLSGSGDRTVRIWQRGFDGRYCCLTLLDGHQTPVRSIAAVVVDEITADDGGGGVGLKVFSGSFDGEIKVWQVEVSSVMD